MRNTPCVEQLGHRLLLVVVPPGPLPRIVVGQEDVVEMHAHAGRQPRDHLAQQEVDVAAGLALVARVDEQNVARAERGERTPVERLDVGLQPFDRQPGDPGARPRDRSR